MKPIAPITQIQSKMPYCRFAWVTRDLPFNFFARTPARHAINNTKTGCSMSTIFGINPPNAPAGEPTKHAGPLKIKHCDTSSTQRNRRFLLSDPTVWSSAERECPARPGDSVTSGLLIRPHSYEAWLGRFGAKTAGACTVWCRPRKNTDLHDLPQTAGKTHWLGLNAD